MISSQGVVGNSDYFPFGFTVDQTIQQSARPSVGEYNGVGLVFLLDVVGQSEMFPLFWNGLPSKNRANDT